MKKIVLVIVLLLGLGVSQAQIVPKNQIEKAVLTDSTGKAAELALFDNEKLSVLVFLSPECPLCRNYTITLNRLREAYGEQIEFYGIVPGEAYPVKEVSQFVKDFDVSFPVYIDPEKKVSNLLKATITPEVFLISPEGEVIYSGGIDNWAVSLGQTRQVITEHYLEEAIKQHLSGKPVLTRRTKAVGCLINMF